MPFDFPTSPPAGISVSNGNTVYMWDGMKWHAGSQSSAPPITEAPTRRSRMIPFVWTHGDTREGHELSQIEWCRWNADGSIYVNWERCNYLANSQTDPADMQQLDTQIMARLLFAARGKFTEVTLAEADRIAEDAAAMAHVATTPGPGTA